MKVKITHKNSAELNKLFEELKSCCDEGSGGGLKHGYITDTEYPQQAESVAESVEESVASAAEEPAPPPPAPGGASVGRSGITQEMYDQCHRDLQEREAIIRDLKQALEVHGLPGAGATQGEPVQAGAVVIERPGGALSVAAVEGGV